MDTSVGGIVLLVIASAVCFALAWTRQDRMPLYVGHALLAAACVLVFLAGAAMGVMVVAGVVLLVDLVLMVRNVAHD
ncbi:MAG: hypothetical protein U0R76_13645 [Candidatus Nanopelagicales bacterium]